jgi:superfamily I DNA/RNA helicase
MPQVVSTPQYGKCIRDLSKKGKKGKDATLKARAAQAEAAESGCIEIVRHTRHGESRLPNIEKYDLGDGYRLVVQLVDPSAEKRAFLFVGDHEDAERWLDNHKDYKWSVNPADKTMEFVQVSDPRESVVIVPDYDVESPESLLELPLLRDVTDEEWLSTGFSEAAIQYLKSVTASLWEQDASGVSAHVEELSTSELAVFAIDVLYHAHRREWDEMHRRFEVNAGKATVVDGAAAAEAMVDPANSEQFVTWEDLAGLPANVDWADWMLFLHPEQKEFATKSYAGPARLRGVSGSGKTCVMVHRARRLAKESRQNVLLVTLTESMRRLLDLLVKTLCGAEAAHIKTSTMNSLAVDAIESLAPNVLKSFTMANDSQIAAIRDDVVKAAEEHPAFSATVLCKLLPEQLVPFIEDEVGFVRMQFLPEEYEKYLQIVRYERELRLTEKARMVILAAVKRWDDGLGKLRLKDHDAVVQTALELLQKSSVAARNTFQYRHVLVDEVQDLSQLEMRILAMIPDQTGKRAVDQKDGMFLVGDGAQTIYRKGFALKDCGISVANRSFVLQKNYRNTREILQAAYGLIAAYEFADVDEENVQVPTQPHLSSRHGEKPMIIKCASNKDESEFVVTTIRQIIEEQRSRDEADELQEPSEIPIGVIGFNGQDRDRISAALRTAKIRTTELRDDVGWDNNAVKISTLESAKGHEFHAVFIVGILQGTIPQWRIGESDWKREAARLYVAMTRARDRLFLSYDIKGRATPSVFLSTIQSDCQEYDFRNGRLVVTK